VTVGPLIPKTFKQKGGRADLPLHSSTSLPVRTSFPTDRQGLAFDSALRFFSLAIPLPSTRFSLSPFTG
jgi:hypothetical protein